MLSVYLFFLGFVANAQNNELFKLLNWNTEQQQQQLLVWYDLQDFNTIKLPNKETLQVYSVNDKGFWKNHVSQPESNNQPILIMDEGFTNGQKRGLSFANGVNRQHKVDILI